MITELARSYGKIAGAGRAALAHPAGQHRVPEVDDAEPGQENFEIFDFELSDADMALISALNKDERTGPNPDEFNYIPGK